jgi:hypothetical protein
MGHNNVFWAIRHEAIDQTTWPTWVVGIILDDLSGGARHAIPNFLNRHLIRCCFSERMRPYQHVSIPHRLLQQSQVHRISLKLKSNVSALSKV